MAKVSEQVAELERERDQARADLAQARVAWAAAERQASAQRWRAETAEGNEAMLRVRVMAAESREKQARVVGARTALTRLAADCTAGKFRAAGNDKWRYVADDVDVREFRDREYPATGEEPTRGEPSVFRADSAFVNSLRVGGSCADCQALNRDASVTWKFCPKHTLSLRASKPGDTTQGSRVDFRTLDNRGVKEVLSDPAPTPEPPRVVRLSGGRVMRWEHNEFGVAWLRRNGSELPPLHYFRNSCGELMYDYRVIAETPEDFTTLERLVQEVCAYLASRPTASGEG